jgi:hypothetical protein
MLCIAIFPVYFDIHTIDSMNFLFLSFYAVQNANFPSEFITSHRSSIPPESRSHFRSEKMKLCFKKFRGLNKFGIIDKIGYDKAELIN